MHKFACNNLDGSQKEGGNFLNFLQKEGVIQKGGGVPLKKMLGVGSNPGGNCECFTCGPKATIIGDTE